MGDSWLGGDIGSLHTAVEVLEPCQAKTKTALTYIDQDVRKISQDAGWSGDAATGFAAHWEIASVAASAVGTFCSAAATTLSTLADQLTRTENALRQAAAAARAQGALIGVDGRPQAGPINPADPAHEAITAYQIEWQQAHQLAQGFRVEADRALLELLTEMMKIIDHGGDSAGLASADKVALADYLRGIGAVPAAVRDHLDKLIGDARADYNEAKAEWKKVRDATPPGQRMPDDVKAPLREAMKEMQGLQTELDALDHAAHPMAKLLNVDVGDVVGQLPRVGGAFADAADGSKAVRFLSDVPVIDVAAAGLGTYFQAKDDIAKGEHPTRAIAEDATANVTGLAVGAAVGGVAIGAATFLGAAPVAAVAAGALIGGTVAVGVGDMVYEGFHEHWDEDFKKHGVLGGLATGTGHVVSNTGKDLANLGKGIWHGVFG
ncbi:hypothetical protein HC031_20755 [Planosporangium thailandense]|uniref:WXG100 family type VII secretion target n=1 Tax=Planosporangium thailandense TaxID=765197 RepID=A0ABX0Y1W0_9ACTN|nr:hypothetical protein [Planosporangium thailandense]NJC72127.1 hypothetical protein [Planosporangium thailandense]